MEPKRSFPADCPPGLSSRNGFAENMPGSEVTIRMAALSGCSSGVVGVQKFNPSTFTRLLIACQLACGQFYSGSHGDK